MIIIFESNNKEIGRLNWNGKSIDVSKDFPAALLRNLKSGVSHKEFSEEKGIIRGSKLYFSDGLKFLRALPTNFSNVYLNARVF